MTYQTDTNFGGLPERAVDGGLSPDYFNGSCTHTLTHTDVTWEVDLGSIYSISNVTIYNRLDCCSEVLSNVQLYAGLSRDTYVLRGYHAGVVGVSHSFNFSGYVSGRWVKIGRLNISSGPLTLCEVQVFGHAVFQAICSTDVSQQVATGNVIRSVQLQNEIQCCYACLAETCLAADFNSSSNAGRLYNSTTSFSSSTGSMLIIPEFD